MTKKEVKTELRGVYSYKTIIPMQLLAENEEVSGIVNLAEMETEVKKCVNLFEEVDEDIYRSIRKPLYDHFIQTDEEKRELEEIWDMDYDTLIGRLASNGEERNFSFEYINTAPSLLDCLIDYCNRENLVKQQAIFKAIKNLIEPITVNAQSNVYITLKDFDSLSFEEDVVEVNLNIIRLSQFSDFT